MFVEKGWWVYWEEMKQALVVRQVTAMATWDGP